MTKDEWYKQLSLIHIYRIAQLIARKPRYSYIELDDFGTFVWHSIDGVRSIYDIGPVSYTHLDVYKRQE